MDGGQAVMDVIVVLVILLTLVVAHVAINLWGASSLGDSDTYLGTRGNF